MSQSQCAANSKSAKSLLAFHGIEGAEASGQSWLKLSQGNSNRALTFKV
jgi:hypothetical protein